MTKMEGKETTLTVFHNGTPIFTSDGNWLHPLFELEEYLTEHAFSQTSSSSRTKSSGRLLLCSSRMGFHTVKAGVLSGWRSGLAASRDGLYL